MRGEDLVGREKGAAALAGGGVLLVAVLVAKMLGEGSPLPALLGVPLLLVLLGQFLSPLIPLGGYLLLFSAPIFFRVGGAFHVHAAEVLLLALAVLAAAELALRPLGGIPGSRRASSPFFTGSASAFLLLAAFSLSRVPDIQEGIQFLLYLSEAFLALLVVTRGLRSLREARVALSLLFLVAGLQASVGILQQWDFEWTYHYLMAPLRIGGDVGPYLTSLSWLGQPRSVGLTGGANDFGPFMAMTALTALGVLLHGTLPWKRGGLVLLLALVVPAWLWSFNRSSLVAAGFTLLVVALRERKVMLGLLLSAAIAVATWNLLESPLREGLVVRRVQSIADLSLGSNWGRLLLWGRAVREIADSPFLGVGLGRSATVLGGVGPHNTYLQITLELGLPGLLAFLLLYGSLLRGAWRRWGGLRGEASLEAGLALAAFMVTLFYGVAALFDSLLVGEIVVTQLLFIVNGLAWRAWALNRGGWGDFAALRAPGHSSRGE